MKEASCRVGASLNPEGSWRCRTPRGTGCKGPEIGLSPGAAAAAPARPQGGEPSSTHWACSTPRWAKGQISPGSRLHTCSVRARALSWSSLKHHSRGMRPICLQKHLRTVFQIVLPLALGSHSFLKKIIYCNMVSHCQQN